MIAVLAGMHPAILRGLLIVVISVTVLASPSLALVVFGGIAIWWGPDVATDYVQSQCRSSWTGKVAAELAEARGYVASAKIYVAKVEDELADAKRQADRWHEELQTARLQVKHLEQQTSKGATTSKQKLERDRLYGRLGLTPDVPDAFLPHIKRAILFSLHPDRHPDGRKAAAQKRFVEAMTVFDLIKDDRQLADV